MTVIDLELTRQLAQKAVEKMGPRFRYVIPGSYLSCHYLPNALASESDPRRKTGCLVGTMLTLAGLTNEEIKVCGSGSVEMFVSALIQNGLDYTVTDEALMYMQVLQNIQDSGATWKTAISAAEREYEEGFPNVRDVRQDD